MRLMGELIAQGCAVEYVQYRRTKLDDMIYAKMKVIDCNDRTGSRKWNYQTREV